MAEMKTGSAAVAEKELKRKTLMGFSEKLGIKDGYAGEKIKDTADRTGAIIAISALILGFLLWTRSPELTGFLLGLLVTLTGIFFAFVIVSVMYSYGDIITMSIEQTQILKRLEARKIAELLAANNQLKQEDTPTSAAKSAASENHPAETAVPDAADETRDGSLAEEMTAAAAKKRETALFKPLLPGSAAYVDRVNRIAQFAERFEAGIVCPICSRQQFSSADECFYCGCKFLYDEDPLVNRKKNPLDQLRHLPA